MSAWHMAKISVFLCVKKFECVYWLGMQKYMDY